MLGMKLKYIIIYFLLISSNTVLAQLVSLKGRVVDRKNNLNLSGVTVKVGTEGTSTDKNGYFALTTQLKTLTERGINFSCIGYLNARLIYEPNHIYEVELVEDNNQLKEVIIGAGDDIIKKAIKRIPANYPDKPIVITGILRTQTWRNKSEYFKSDAILKAYIPPYSGSEKTTVTVLQNHIDTVFDRSLRYVRHIENYNVVDFEDIVHNRFILNKISKKRKFDYLLIGKQVYNHHKVFVINTTLKDTSKQYDKIDATLYIDTASYAFVAANIYIYNWVQIGLLTIKKLNYTVAYEEIGKKWYLAETHASHTAVLKNQAPQSTTDFIRTKIDSINVQRIPYKDIIQQTDDIFLVDKRNSKEEWAKNDSLFKKAESEGRMEILSNTLLDSIKKNNAITNPPNQKVKRPFGNRVLDYLSKDNVRTILGLTKFPVVINNPLDVVSGSVNYGWGFGSNYRVYKNLFVGFDLYTNFWNNKHIGLSTIALNLSNDFVFNKSSRSITLTPYVGYEQIAISYQKTKIDYNTLNYGLRVSYELTHKKALFLSSGFNSLSGTSTLNGLTITPTHYAIGLGIVFKK